MYRGFLWLAHFSARVLFCLTLKYYYLDALTITNKHLAKRMWVDPPRSGVQPLAPYVIFYSPFFILLIFSFLNYFISFYFYFFTSYFNSDQNIFQRHSLFFSLLFFSTLGLFYLDLFGWLFMSWLMWVDEIY